MQACEIPHLNVFYVQAPHVASTPLDMLPHREEIAEPRKMLALTQTEHSAWDPIELEGNLGLYRTWITWRKSYMIQNQKISSSGFYALTEDPIMFTSMLDVDSTSAEAIFQWLQTWGKSFAIVTSPLMTFSTPSNMMLYGIPNDINTHPFPIIPMFDLTEQLIQQSAYTLINGFTLALAFHRLNIWETEVFHTAVQMWFMSIDTTVGWINTTQENAFLFFQHPVPHIGEHPLHYSVMGKDKADLKIVKLLKKWIYSMIDNPMIQVTIGNHQYFTSVCASMFPYVNQAHWKLFEKNWLNVSDSFDDSTTIMNDIHGFFISICKSRTRHKWWIQNRDRYVPFLLSQKTTMLFKRLFHIYNFASDYDVCHSRVRELWKFIMKILKKQTMIKSVFNIVLFDCVHSRLYNQNVNIWLSKVPIAFMKDFREFTKTSFDYFEKFEHKLVYDIQHEAFLQSLFDDKIQSITSTDIPSRNCITVKINMMESLRCFPQSTQMYKYSRMIEHDLTRSIWALKTIFYNAKHDVNRNYTLWMILDTHLRDYPNLWM